MKGLLECANDDLTLLSLIRSRGRSGQGNDDQNLLKIFITVTVQFKKAPIKLILLRVRLKC